MHYLHGMLEKVMEIIIFLLIYWISLHYIIINGTIGGSPEALDHNNPSSAVIYDNGFNVFPIYVNFYPYNGNTEEQEIPCNNGFEVSFNNTQFNNVKLTNAHASKASV